MQTIVLDWYELYKLSYVDLYTETDDVYKVDNSNNNVRHDSFTFSENHFLGQVYHVYRVIMKGIFTHRLVECKAGMLVFSSCAFGPKFSSITIALGCFQHNFVWKNHTEMLRKSANILFIFICLDLTPVIGS